MDFGFLLEFELTLGLPDYYVGDNDDGQMSCFGHKSAY